MAEAHELPDEKKAKMLENLAKARATRAENLAKASSLTEQAKAPETEISTPDPEKAALQRQLAEAEQDKEAALAALEKATKLPALPPVQFMPPPQAQLPRNMRVERSGNVSAPTSVRWPQIRGGTCEFCGVLDPNVPAQYQYKLCPHFRGMSARCTYCPENKDPDEITYHANLNVATHPDNPNTLIMWCNSYACSDAHIKRWSKATA